MGQNMVTLPLVAVTLMVLPGCSSLTGRPLSGGPPPCEQNWMHQRKCEDTNGVPYALSRPRFSIQRKTLSGGKKASPVYEVVVSYEADVSRRFEVGMSKGVFTSDTFELSLDPTGRALALNSTRKDETGKTIAALVTAGAAATGVAAKAALLAKAKGLPLVAGLCSQIKTLAKGPLKQLDDQLKQLDDQQKQINDDRLKPEHDDIALNRRQEELDHEKEKLTQQLEDIVCTKEEASIGANPSPPNGCKTPDSLDASCRKQIKGVADKARKLLTSKLCGRDTYLEKKEIVSTDPSILLMWKSILSVEKLTADKGRNPDDPDPNEELAKELKRLRENADAAVAAAAKAPNDGEKKRAMEGAIDALRDAVEIVLNADERLNRRALGDRRKVLLKFLTANPPTGKRQAEAYAQYSAQLNAVDEALQGIVPKPGVPSTPLSDATDLTSTIDRGVLTERYRRALTDAEVEDRVALAHAEIGLGCVRAVVITAPEATRQSGGR